jgi:hypothetical protein
MKGEQKRSYTQRDNKGKKIKKRRKKGKQNANKKLQQMKWRLEERV